LRLWRSRRAIVLEGKVEELQIGGVMAHVVIRVGENLIESVITRRSAEETKLKIGDTVSAVIKSTEVMLEKRWNPSILVQQC
jgi:molybdopterin-binding protein